MARRLTILSVAAALALAVEVPADAAPFSARGGVVASGIAHSIAHTAVDPTASTIECSVTPPAEANVMLTCPGDRKLANTEPSIAVDPADPDHIVVGANEPPANTCNVGLAPCPSEFATTFDGGISWTIGDLSTEPNHNVGLDPALSFDVKNGTVIYAVLSNRNACGTDVAAAVSTDGGVHWDRPVVVADGHGCFPNDVQYDRDNIVTDNNPASPNYGTTYVTATRFACRPPDCDPTTDHGELTIVEMQSRDGGRTWTKPRVISGSSPSFCTAPPGPPACTNSAGSWPAVSPDGSVHVAFQNAQNEGHWSQGECCEEQFLAVNSTDGGVTWSDPTHVVDLEDGSRDYPDCSVGGGAASCPLTGTQLAIPAFGWGNLVASPIDGTLYLPFSDNRNGAHDVDHPVTNTDVFLMRSEDGGKTWVGPLPVSTSPGDQWFPYAAVDPVTGDVGVVFYDRGYGDGSTFDVTLATGLPGSFELTRVTTEPSHLRNNLWYPAHVQGCWSCYTGLFNDYLSLAYGPDGVANVAWSDIRTSVSVRGAGSGYTEMLAVARV